MSATVVTTEQANAARAALAAFHAIDCAEALGLVAYAGANTRYGKRIPVTRPPLDEQVIDLTIREPKK